jgi:MoxR-like ATPase
MTDQAINQELSVEEFQTTTAAITREVGKIIVGQEEVIRLVLICVFAGGHALLEGVPGLGKTTLVRALATSLNLRFSRIQFTPDLMPADVTGTNIMEETEDGRRIFRFQQGPVFANMVLADEINRATPRTQSALLEAMQERQITADGETRLLPRPFLIMATQNPIELEGTFPLPEAQLDRFLLRLRIGYPDEADENVILKRFRTDDPLATLGAVTEPAQINALIEQVREVRVEESVQNYIVKVARQTREHGDIALGASPRATMALYRTAQAWAAIHGEHFVTPDHVKFLAPYVLIHRIMISPQMRLRGRTPEEVLADVIESVPVPVVQS